VTLSFLDSVFWACIETEKNNIKRNRKEGLNNRDFIFLCLSRTI